MNTLENLKKQREVAFRKGRMDVVKRLNAKIEQMTVRYAYTPLTYRRTY